MAEALAVGGPTLLFEAVQLVLDPCQQGAGGHRRAHLTARLGEHAGGGVLQDGRKLARPRGQVQAQSAHGEGMVGGDLSLQQDAPQLAPADNDVVGPFQAGVHLQGIAQHGDGHQAQPDREAPGQGNTVGRDDHRKVQPAAIGPSATLAAVARGLPPGHHQGARARVAHRDQFGHLPRPPAPAVPDAQPASCRGAHAAQEVVGAADGIQQVQPPAVPQETLAGGERRQAEPVPVHT